MLTHDEPPEEYEATIERLRELTRELPEGIKIFESGELPLFHSSSRYLISTLVRSLYLALPLIVIVIGLSFGSLRAAALSTIPNVLPLTFGMAFIAVVGISLRFSTIVPFPVALGLAVDDTIHFLARYRSERRAGASVQMAVKTTLRTTGRAMVTTTVFLIGGYLVLTASSFLAAVHMGIVSIAILITALFGDLLVLPSLLLLFDSETPA